VPEGPQVVRSFVAVGAGFFAIQMLGWGADQALRALVPAGFDAQGRALDGRTLLMMLAYMAVLEAVGGYITARLAIRKPTTHAMILGFIVLAMSLAFTVFTWGNAPHWYQIWALLLILPMTVLGGHSHELLARQSSASSR
jgi:hypothetical protein